MRAMTPREFSDRIDAVLTEVASWTTDPREWGRPDLDGAGEVWDRLDRLITDLTILRRDHAVVLAHRIDDQQTLYTRDGTVIVHRDVPRTERWDGHAVLGALGDEMVSRDGEIVDAIPVDVARAVLPACVQGQTSSRWKITELRKVLDAPESFREVDYGDAVIARGPLPSRVRHARPPAVHEAATVDPQENGYPVDNPNSGTDLS